MKKKIKIPNLKKEIKDFLLSEEGKISKIDVAKIGISLAVLSMMFQSKIVSAGHSSSIPHSSGAVGHSNQFLFSGSGGHDSGPPHISHGVHASHGSHGSHAQW